MLEARRRNSAIHLSALPWGVPGWVSPTSTGYNYHDLKALSDFLLSWLSGLQREKNLTIDSIGVAHNEGPFNSTWAKIFRKQLNAAGFHAIKTIASDSCGGDPINGVAKGMGNDPVLNASIDIIGSHNPGASNGHKGPTPKTLLLNKPMWNTEAHFQVLLEYTLPHPLSAPSLSSSPPLYRTSPPRPPSAPPLLR
jgi:hypothetical protein